jgi:hypothetical protein
VPTALFEPTLQEAADNDEIRMTNAKRNPKSECLLMNFGATRFEIRKYAQTGDDRPGGKLASFLLSVFSLFASFAPFRG